MVLAYWGFVLMSIHAGTHLQPLLQPLHSCSALPRKLSAISPSVPYSYLSFLFFKCSRFAWTSEISPRLFYTIQAHKIYNIIIQILLVIGNTFTPFSKKCFQHRNTLINQGLSSSFIHNSIAIRVMIILQSGFLWVPQSNFAYRAESKKTDSEVAVNTGFHKPNKSFSKSFRPFKFLATILNLAVLEPA